MKLIYLDCNMGIAGDMFMAALYELLTEEKKEEFLHKMSKLGLSGIRVEPEPVVRCGICGTHMKVEVCGQEEEGLDITHGSENHHGHRKEGEEHSHEHHRAGEHGHHHGHHHTSMEDIRNQIALLPVSDKVKEDSIAVYGKIAEAESAAHGKTVEEIHFHEVGTMDAVADIVGTCLLMEMLAPDKVIASPVHTGFGQVRCAHGILPVPAPATAYLLKKVPSAAGSIEGELCTPTGAALLTYFADAYGTAPEMVTENIGYGMGRKEFPAANCVRSCMGEAAEQTLIDTAKNGKAKGACGTGDTIAELDCNLDDMTPEAIGYAVEVLFENGALDVFTVPVGMKKNRPGVLLVCICKKEDAKRMAELMLFHTTTLGVREKECHRYKLDRNVEAVQTTFGPVRIKTAVLTDGTVRRKPEYDDVAAIARQKGLPYAKVTEEIERALL